MAKNKKFNILDELNEIEAQLMSQSLSKRPKVIVNNRQLRDLVNDVMKAMEQANNPPFLFVRGGRLVRVVKDERNHAFIDEISEKAMMIIIAREVDFFVEKWTEDGMRSWNTPPPLRVVQSVLASGEWKFPSLLGISTIPPVNLSGEIILKEGYSSLFAKYYSPDKNLKIAEIPSQPTHDQLQEAKKCLFEPFLEFPFEDESSRTNLIASLLTLILRDAIEGPVPFSIISATNRGTGKTLISRILGTILLGSEPSLTTFPRQPEELKKTITSLLLKGSQLVIFDNVTGSLDTPELAAVLTARVWEDRILGQTRTISVPQNAAWIVNGNNINVRNDLVRRSIMIRMKSELSQPWLKNGFVHKNLISWVLKNRGNILWSAYVLFRFWLNAGSPEPSIGNIGGYEEWVRVIGGILETAGIAGFLGNLDLFYEVSEDQENQAEIFLDAISKKYESRLFTTADVANELLPPTRLIDHLPDRLIEQGLLDMNNPPDPKFKITLGKYFASINETRFGKSGIYIRRAEPDTHTKVNRWQVVRGDRG